MNVLAIIIAVIVMISLIVYALMAGADFGAGIWSFFARGPRAYWQRHAISDAIAPIWEANHVWLILVVVLMFTGFPHAFSAMMISLHIPISLMLVGIVLRGSAFVFRKYDTRGEVFQRRWNMVFGVASLFTPVLQGMILGALATGRIRVLPTGEAQTGFFEGWLTPFAVACGFFAAALFAFLAATYLTHDLRGDPKMQNDFGRRALWAQGFLAVLSLVVFFASKSGAPVMYAGLTNWWAPLLLAWTGLAAGTATVALWLRKYELARVAAIAEVGLILTGWSIAQFPNLITPDVTVFNSAAPEITLRLLVVALGTGAIVLLPSLVYLFHVFKRDHHPKRR
jgi:cytochrome bd ubiquinol oxidase subunit II